MKAFIIVVLFLILNSNSLISKASKLYQAREQYYQSIKDEDKLEPTIELFEEIYKENPQLEGMCRTYVGSLVMLKGKHAFWPHKKVSFVNEGIPIMDKGLNLDPDNIESLFIYGSSCYYLPFFLGKGNLAEEKLKKIVAILNQDDLKKYDKKILVNALEFILKNIDLNSEEKIKINDYLTILK